MSDESSVEDGAATRATGEPRDQVWTVPNLISTVRIVLIVVFVVLLAGRHDGWAIAALIGAGVSDFLDGYLARRWDQVTRLGRILDPAADRLLTLAVVIGLAARGVIPWWLTAVLLTRDAVVGVALLVARARGAESSQVTLVGKAATFGLYVFLPWAYIAFLAEWPIAWTVFFVGTLAATVLYWVSGVGYVVDLVNRSRATVPPAGA
ncbi:CDP-alcohol phosphatidyltransferase family protein [Demequina sp. SYSU T00039]|uniref:CDP-alcohol phosphatidyltransferase family protein n=1 Tax=Demequina lignilytica TaxID=3051663 RepID=A0AAW7M1K5_9MICO|nr:CDP-alcohol phosphatidyltransferase family protein [Demequina sp. SYSU T00039]MDN4486655.1 CDP-alcohol phosphatidyltransferase family protein [Demequina sp. SYSU T00039]